MPDLLWFCFCPTDFAITFVYIDSANCLSRMRPGQTFKGNTIMSPNSSFDPVAKTLHWLMAVLMIGALIFGLIMEDASHAEKASLLQGHSGVGLTVFFLALFRIYWRRTHEPPALPAGMKSWELKLAKINAGLLYALMLYIPLMGFLHAATSVEEEVHPFGLFNVTALLPSSEGVTDIFHELHEIGAFLLIAVVVLHAVAAFKHLIIDKDRVFQRMFPFMKG
ncbi:MAG: cytochrome b [Alphaproteobacteria bacterium]|nr:MAG: cytochrome b [Alphaproteobacteria bacterium]